VYLCPTAFKLIFGISGQKLFYAGKFITEHNCKSFDSMPEYVATQKFVHSPKKIIIRSFLQHTYEELSIPVDPLDKENLKRYALGTFY
jgi:hypothetical protein